MTSNTEDQMKRLTVSLFVAVFAFLDARANAVACQSTFPTSCPFNYATSGRPAVINLKDFNCASDPISSNPPPVSDTMCWQQALNCAFDPTPGSFKLASIQATEGVTYNIDDTLCVVGARDGVINGNGAQLN